MLQPKRFVRNNSTQLIEIILMSKTRFELAGMPGMPLLPYPRFAGILIRRSPPRDMPATPMSQPLMTSPEPSLNVNGLPFLFAVDVDG